MTGNLQSVAANATPIYTALGAPKGYAQITELVAAVGVGTIPPGATRALLRCEAQNVRWRDDGTAPTANIGQLMLPADLPFLYAGDLTAIKFIEATDGATLNICFY